MSGSGAGVDTVRAGIGKKGSGVTRAWVMLGCAWLLGFAMYAPMLCIPPIVHIVKNEFGVSHAEVGLLFAIPVTMLILLAIPGGFLADRLGTQKAVGIGATVMAIGSLLRGVSGSFTSLMVFTALYGVGFSIIYPNLAKLVGGWFPREKVSLATGVYSTGIVMGGATPLAVTLPLVFPLTNTIQGTFVIWSMPCVAAAALWWLLAKDPPPKDAIAEPHTSIRPSATVRVTARSYSLWKDRNMWLIAFLLFLNNIHFYAWSGWSPALFMMKGASPDLAALIASSRGWAGLLVIFLMPWASYKVGLRKPFLWGAAFLLVVVSVSAIYIPVPLGWPLMILVGIAGTGTFSMILALPLELLPTESVGTASGTVLSIGYLGGLVGPWLTGKIVDLTGNFDLALIFLMITAFVWAVIGFVIPETGNRAMRHAGHRL
jgi:cyanate permease